MRDVIEMAREVGLEEMWELTPRFTARLKALADLVRADEREQALAAPVQDSTCNNALREQGKSYPRTCRKCGLGPCIALANIALDKKAENARELGLDYEPAPVQEPVAWGVFEGNLHDMFFSRTEADYMAYLKGAHAEVRPLYTTPPAAQRQWVGLTDEEIEKACVPLGAAMLSFTEVARVIEAKLKEKNT
jgi:hypothetical protein